MAKAKTTPRKVGLPPFLREYVLAPENKAELSRILANPVFQAACALVSEQSKPSRHFETAMPDNFLNRLCAFHEGRDTFYEALASLLSTKKTDPVPNTSPGWGETALNPNA
jgi:hypothetical protein